MTGTVHVRGFLFLAVVLLAPGCAKEDNENQPTDAAGAIICPELYQGSDFLADALAFIEVPQERMESSLRSVSRRGQLADPQQLAFANRLFSVRRSRDTELFKSLVSDATRRQLDGPDDNKQMVRHHLREIESGRFLYGELDCKFFATFHALTQDELDSLTQDAGFAQRPTHSVVFYHLHRPKTMLIGTTIHLIQSQDTYTIVTASMQIPVVPGQALEPSRQE
ncbi:MAG: hypothetical protein JW993_02620 [Sedimentisphaerales bacterium]|nr:hypothetical protein [Sedimentisphaerales bacterium]